MEKFTEDMEHEVEDEDCQDPNDPKVDTKVVRKENEGPKEIEESEENEVIIYFNEDLLCEHNSLKTPDSTRKVVPREAWTILRKYFPESKEYPIGSGSCSICEVRSLLLFVSERKLNIFPKLCIHIDGGFFHRRRWRTRRRRRRTTR